MNHRSEPRFKTEAPASIQVLRDHAQEFEAMITDASSVGLGIQMSDPLRPREVVRICTESDYVFAIVQHCTAIAEDRYSVGVVRIDEWHSVGDRKPDLESLRKDAPSTMEAVEKPRLDLGDLQTHAIKDLFQQSPDKSEQRAQKKAKTKKGSLDAAAARLQAAAGASASDDSKQAETSESPEDDKPGSKPEEARPPKKSVGRAKVIGASAGLVILLLLLAGVGSGFRFGLGQPANAEFTRQTTEIDRENAPDPEEAAVNSTETLQASDSSEPDGTADDALEESETQATIPSPAANAAVASPETGQNRMPDAPRPAPPQPAASPSPAAGGREHAVLIRSSGASWITVCIDHARAFEGLIEAGNSREFSYRDQMLLRSGNIGALSLSRDSEPVSTSNVVGTIAAWEFTATGAQRTNVEATQNCN